MKTMCMIALILASLMGPKAFTQCEGAQDNGHQFIILRHIDSQHVLIGSMEDNKKVIDSYTGAAALFLVSSPIAQGFMVMDFIMDISKESPSEVYTKQAVLKSEFYLQTMPEYIHRIGRSKYEGKEIDLWTNQNCRE